ncbi:MAG: TRAP transporter small permease [Pseudothermotoga sp.]
MDKVKKILNFIDRSIRWFGTVSLVVMLCIALLDLFFRDILLKPISWSLEFILLIMLWLAMLNSAVGVRNDLHISMGLFVSSFSKRTKGILSIFINLLIVYYAWITIKGCLYMAKLPGRMSILRLHYGWMYYSGVVCGILLILFCVERIIQTILGWFKK